MEELGVDVSAGDVSGSDVTEPVIPVASEDLPVQIYETVVDISPLINAVEIQTAESQKGFSIVAMLLGIIVGMIFMKGFWTSRG